MQGRSRARRMSHNDNWADVELLDQARVEVRLHFYACVVRHPRRARATDSPSAEWRPGAQASATRARRLQCVDRSLWRLPSIQPAANAKEQCPRPCGAALQTPSSIPRMSRTTCRLDQPEPHGPLRDCGWACRRAVLRPERARLLMWSLDCPPGSGRERSRQTHVVNPGTDD